MIENWKVLDVRKEPKNLLKNVSNHYFNDKKTQLFYLPVSD